MSFFNELKRRNVFRVGAAYAVLAWLLIQIIDTVLPTFGAPDWVTKTLMFVIILGFPVALVLAWAFEITADGIKSQKAADAAHVHSSGNRLNAFIIVVIVLAVAYMAADNYMLSDDTSGSVTPAVPGTANQVLDAQ